MFGGKCKREMRECSSSGILETLKGVPRSESSAQNHPGPNSGGQGGCGDGRGDGTCFISKLYLYIYVMVHISPGI